MEVVTLRDSHFRQVVPTLRAIADEIEAGKYGEVGCLSVALLGDKLHVFAMGPDSEAASAALVLHAGFMKLSQSLVEHGE